MPDDDPGFFAGRLAILGLGLMGGSLAMALQVLVVQSLKEKRL
jgi:hypothetical protein